MKHLPCAGVWFSVLTFTTAGGWAQAPDQITASAEAKKAETQVVEERRAEVVAPGDFPLDGGKWLDGMPALIDPATTVEGVDVFSGAEGGAPKVLSVEEAAKKLARARQKQERWARLSAQGVLSKMEAETCAVEVATALAAMQRAQVQAAKLACSPEAKDATGTPEERQAALAKCEAECQEAEAALAKVRLENAQRNLGRFEKLYAQKLATKAQLDRARAMVARLTAVPPAAVAGNPVVEVAAEKK